MGMLLPHQIIAILVIAAAAFVLAMLLLRQTGHARGRGWMIFALVVIIALGVVTMLLPMFGFYG